MHSPASYSNRNPSPRISCVMPAYNEARNLGLVVPQVLTALQALSTHVELLVVDDGSRDDTALVMHGLCAAYPQVSYIQLSRNFGKEAALTAGVDAALGDVVVLMDADGQHPASLLREMLLKWQHGSDVVYAVRTARHDQSALHVSLTGLFYKLINLRSRVQIPANAGDFRLMDRKVVNALKSLPERNRFMKGLYAWVGFRNVIIPYVPAERHAGASTFSLRSLARLAFTGVTAFTNAPLRLWSALGVVVALFAIAFGLWIVIEYFIYGNKVPGWATLVTGMMFFSGVQLLSIGILGEYVGRIFDEVKQRPVYIVSSESGRGAIDTPPAP